MYKKREDRLKAAHAEEIEEMQKRLAHWSRRVQQMSEEHQKELMNIYDQKVKDWPEDTEDIYIKTSYGSVHVLACGSKYKPPLLLFHAASMGAHSWAENLEPLLSNYRIFAIDNIGEGNKSKQ